MSPGVRHLEGTISISSISSHESSLKTSSYISDEDETSEESSSSSDSDMTPDEKEK